MKKKNTAAVFENKLNFGKVSQSISFFHTLEEAKQASKESHTFQYTFHSKVATKSVDWVAEVKKILPKNVEIEEVLYKPIMASHSVRTPFPMVDGIEVTIKLRAEPHSAFAGTLVTAGFYKDKKFGIDVVKSDSSYKVVRKEEA